MHTLFALHGWAWSSLLNALDRVLATGCAAAFPMVTLDPDEIINPPEDPIQLAIMDPFSESGLRRD